MLTGRATISEAILLLFRERQEYTAAEILALLQRKGSCSQRGMYKELRGLIERGIIVRSGRRYSLSLTWVLALIRLAEDFYGTLVEDRLKASYLPEPGGKRTWRFYDLQHLDRFWLQMIFLLYEESKSREMYAWVPYFWFDLVHYEKDLEAQEAMRTARNKMHLILGHDCYLTRLPVKYWSKDVYRWSYTKGPFDDLRTIYYDVIDEFVLTVELTAKTTREIHDLFEAVGGHRDLGKIAGFEKIKAHAPCKLTIERSPRKAAKLLRQFRDYFTPE